MKRCIFISDNQTVIPYSESENYCVQFNKFGEENHAKKIINFLESLLEPNDFIFIFELSHRKTPKAVIECINKICNYRVVTMIKSNHKSKAHDFYKIYEKLCVAPLIFTDLSNYSLYNGASISLVDGIKCCHIDAVKIHLNATHTFENRILNAKKRLKDFVESQLGRDNTIIFECNNGYFDYEMSVISSDIQEVYDYVRFKNI